MADQPYTADDMQETEERNFWTDVMSKPANAMSFGELMEAVFGGDIDLVRPVVRDVKLPAVAFAPFVMGVE